MDDENQTKLQLNDPEPLGLPNFRKKPKLSADYKNTQDFDHHQIDSELIHGENINYLLNVTAHDKAILLPLDTGKICIDGVEGEFFRFDVSGLNKPLELQLCAGSDENETDQNNDIEDDDKKNDDSEDDNENDTNDESKRENDANDNESKDENKSDDDDDNKNDIDAESESESFLSSYWKFIKGLVGAGSNNNDSNSNGNRNNNGGDSDPFNKITLNSLGGLDNHIAWLKQCILKPLKNDSYEKTWGIKPPKGVLFYGPPGTGKTLLAQAFGNEISKELKRPVQFYHRKGGDFLSMYLGESSKNVRQLFEEAIRNKPSIIFLDELDGICPNRDGNNVRQSYISVVTTLLGQMDNVPAGEVFVFGATNRLESIDPAMRRPGRFDKLLEFLPPNVEGRKKIIHINTKKWKRSHPNQIFLDELSKKTVGFTGADLEKLCRETFFAAFQRHVPNADLNASIEDIKILEEDWDTAFDKVKPSGSAVYGSRLYLPQLPSSEVFPLVFNIQSAIVKQLMPLIPRGIENWKDNISNANDFSISTQVTSFYIWDQRQPGRDALESIILPGVFAHSICSDLPIYRLTKEDILCSPSEGSQLTLITDTINQAADFLKPCIFFLPRIDEIMEDKPTLAEVVAEQLKALSGKPVLIIATASCSCLDLECKATREVFGNIDKDFKIQRPQASEREEFLRPIFMIAASTVKGNKTVPKNEEAFRKVMDETVKRTTGDSIELLISLYGTLLRTVSKSFPNGQKENLVNDLESDLNQYCISKFKP